MYKLCLDSAKYDLFVDHDEQVRIPILDLCATSGKGGRKPIQLPFDIPRADLAKS
jgi:hypothetical protein